MKEADDHKRLGGSIAPPERVLPVIDFDNEAYWTGGKDGELRIYRCQDCAYFVHPPVKFCPKCESRQVQPEAVSGRGTIESFTINHKAWVPGLPVPYVLALVTIAEQDDVRLVSNIINCPAEDVKMGMPVQVLFQQIEDLWVPFFEPSAPLRTKAGQ